MKLSAKTLAEDIKKVELSAELMKFYNENSIADMAEAYGEDAEIDETVDLFVEKANAYLAAHEKKEEPKKEEPKKPEPKKEPKKPEPKKEEPKKPAGSKLTPQNLKSEIKNVSLSAELMKFYEENSIADMAEAYGEDAEIDETVDLFVEKANAYLAANAGKKDEPKKPEPKKDEPKKKPEKKAEPKKEPKEKKEPKAKQPKKKLPAALFKTGSWAIDNTCERAGIISERLSYSDERGCWLYHIEYVGSKEQSLVAECDLSKTRAPKAIVQTGELVPELPAEIKIINRYIALDGKKLGKIGDEPRLVLAALQKMIINKQIRKTSKYAKEINAMQDSLIKLVNSRAKDAEISIEHIDELRKIVARQNVSEISNISRKFVTLIGQPDKKKEAKALYERIMKRAFKGDDSTEAATMKKALKAYIDGENETVYATGRELRGIYGLAGI
jgi:ribosomal protein L17